MGSILTEIPPLSEKDFFYAVERYKQRFDYPLHRHKEYEINFVARCNGARRIVGDSMETLGEFDLVVVGPDLEHVWEQHDCDTGNIYEITIQFNDNFFNDSILHKTHIAPIKALLEDSRHGVCFDTHSILRAYSLLEDLLREESGFRRFIVFLELLNQLATSPGRRVLASTAFAKSAETDESRRVRKVKAYIDTHFSEEISLDQLASLASMTTSAFSRFFRTRTGITVSDYIMRQRLGHVSRMLVDTSMSVAEICFQCGFNNVSNFNRLFKREKGCTPKEFRETYRKNTIVV